MVTVDQRGSRRSADRVADLLPRLQRRFRTVLPFERTAGDEFQALLDDAAAVVDLVLHLVREDAWSIGVGAGSVQAPLPSSTRAATGPAFLAARRAVDAAKPRPSHVAVRGAVAAEAGDAQAVLAALAGLVDRRSDEAWEAIAQVSTGRTQAQAAAALGISRQAVGQRLAAARWDLEQELRPTAARLLARAAGEAP